MGNVEDVRKVIQDFVAPDLNALEARISALEREMNTGFEHAEKISLGRFASVEKSIAKSRETIMNTIAANQATIMNTLDMERRLARLETERIRTEPQHA